MHTPAPGAPHSNNPRFCGTQRTTGQEPVFFGAQACSMRIFFRNHQTGSSRRGATEPGTASVRRFAVIVHARLMICIQLPKTTIIKKTRHLGFVARLSPIMRAITRSTGLRRTLPCSGSEPS